MDQPNFYAIIPANVRYDKNLKPNAKLLYGEITALCNRDGFCWAANDYFAELYNVDAVTISRWISQLVSGGYVSTEILKNEGNKRKIYIADLLTKKSRPIDKKINRVLTKKSIAIDKKVNSNIRINNTINNTENKEDSSLAFFEKNYPSRFESLMMQYKNQINDFVRFSESFEATVMQEKLEYDGNVLEGRFRKYAMNWVANQNKFEKPVIELNSNANQPQRKFFKG